VKQSAARPSPVTAAIVPIVAEDVKVTKRRVARSRVRISKRVRTETVVVDEPLRRVDVVVERVRVGRLVDAAPRPRWDGETLIVPIVEEVAVVSRRWRLVEELRVRRRSVTYRKPQSVSVRREEGLVERLPARNEPKTRRRGGAQE
jgi:uncharacterized protein (TIGR02271 family)